MGDLLKVDKDLKAIISSGYAQGGVLSDYRRYGFKGILTKPYTVESFAQILSEVIMAEANKVP